MCNTTKDAAKGDSQSDDKATLPGTKESGPGKLKQATRLGALSMGLNTLAASLTIPYLQSRRDELGCDSVCYGSMTSTRSTLALIGAALVGRISDIPYKGGNSRRLCLFLGVAAAMTALATANRARTLVELWWSLFPNMFQQNMSVMKALFSEYHSMYDDTENSKGSPKSATNTGADRASSAGTLGMVAGLSFMVGPMMGSILLANYDQATMVSMVLLLLSAVVIALLPSVDHKDKKDDPEPKNKSLLAFLDVPSARSPAAIFVLVNRLLMSMSDQIFSVICPSSLKERFEFGPKLLMFFSMIGLFYAFAQGFAAKRALQRFGGHTSQGRSRLFVVCLVTVSVARYWAFYSYNLRLVYMLYAIMVTAFGISATMVTADASRIPAVEEVGSFFGIMAAVESGAGVIGPLIASALVSTMDLKEAPLYASVGFNIASAVLTFFAYDQCVFQHMERQKQKEEVAHKKTE